jgi:non-ribosomal peptide synthetase component F
MLILQNAMLRPLQRSARTLSFLETNLSLLLPPLVATTFDAILLLRDRSPGLTVSAIYKRDLFDPETIDRMVRDFQQVLERLVAQPEQPLSALRFWDGEHG